MKKQFLIGCYLLLLALAPGCGSGSELPQVPGYTPEVSTETKAAARPAPASPGSMVPGSPRGVNLVE